jgi:hypothetical protein
MGGCVVSKTGIVQGAIETTPRILMTALIASCPLA